MEINKPKDLARIRGALLLPNPYKTICVPGSHFCIHLKTIFHFQSPNVIQAAVLKV